MKKHIFSIMTVSALVTLASCSSDNEITTTDEAEAAAEETVTEEEAIESSVMVRFTTTASAASARDTFSDDEIQSTEEKTVTRLLAVIFYVGEDDGTVENGSDTETAGNEDDDATYYKTRYVVGSYNDGYIETLDESEEYEIEAIGTGLFQMVFVANPSEDLELEIMGMTVGTSTLSDFKALLAQQTPETKESPGMTMTSTYIYNIATGDETVSLGTVHLQRIMSRIDIINLADGLIVTKAVLHNQNTESVLINDDMTEHSWDGASYTDATFEFETVLTGNSNFTDGISEEEYSELTSTEEDSGNTYVVNASKADIYSYENYSGLDDKGFPSIDIYYTIGEDATTTYIHTVEFKTTSTTTTDEDDSDSSSTTEEALYFKRNYCYKIFLSYTAKNEIEVSLITVADWESGDEIVVSQNEIIDGMVTTTDSSDSESTE